MFIFDTNIRIFSLAPVSSQRLPPRDPPRVYSACGNRIAFHLKELLKTAGWTHRSSGDGLAAFTTTPGNGNDVITHENTGANGMNNDLAWFVMQDPSNARYFGFQGTNYGTFGDPMTDWRVKYSKFGFGLGTPSPTQMPSDTSETDNFVLGGGSDASPFFSSWLNYNTSNPKNGWCHMAADNADPFGFWVGGYSLNVESNSPFVAAVFDPLVPGTYPAGETDPYVIYFSQNSGNAFGREIEQGFTASAFINGNWDPHSLSGLQYGSDGDRRISMSGPANRFNHKFDRMPLIWVDFENTNQIKGQSSLMYWTNYNMQQGIRQFACGKTFQRVSPRDTILIEGIFLPWNGTLPNR